MKSMSRYPKTLIAILTTAATVTTNAAFAQSFTKYNQASQAGGASINYKIEPSESKAEGTPYYLGDWKTGTVYNRGNTFTEFQKLKYNVFLDELIFLHQGTQYIVPQKERIERFTLGDENFVGAFDGSRYTFYKVLEDGARIMLLKHFRCNIAKGQPSKGYIPATPDEYVLKEDIYILKRGNLPIQIVPKKASKFLSYIPDKIEEVQAYIKSSKLKMNDLEDLKAVVLYYNSIE